jgi:MSHA biogenesis protein MshO
MSAPRHARGFTLIELVVALVVGAIIFGLMGMMIAAPIDSFFAQGRRARLSESVEAVWQSVDRDVRAALPLNVRRIQGANFAALEMLNVTTAGRYPAGTLPGPVSNFTPVGNFDLARATTTLAIVPTGVPPNGAYAPGNNVMTPSTTNVGLAQVGPVQTVTFSTPMTFSAGSLRRRAFFVSGAVSYVCDVVAGTVTRYSGYNISAVQPVFPAAFVGGQVTVIATGVTACAFEVLPPVAPAPPADFDNGGVVTIRYTITTPDGESMTLYHESRVENPA